MRKTKIFAYNGKVGIIGGTQAAPKTSDQSGNLVSISNIQMTKEAFDIISKLPKATVPDGTLVSSDNLFGWTGPEWKIVTNDMKVSKVMNLKALKPQIVKEIHYDEQDKEVFDVLVYAMR